VAAEESAVGLGAAADETSPPVTKRSRKKPAFLARNYALTLSFAERMRRRAVQSGRDPRFTVADLTREMFDVSEMLYGRASSPLLMSPGTTYRALSELVKRGYLSRHRSDPNTGGLDSFTLTQRGIDRAPIELTTLTSRRNPPLPPDPQLLVEVLSGQPLEQI
jgi:hypothetical protein